MSIKVMSYVWQHSQAREGDLLVLLALADYATEDWIAWPKIEQLAKKARMSERGVQKALARLEQRGEIAVERATGRGNGSRYKVNKVHHLNPEHSSPFGPETPNTVHLSDPERVNLATRKGELGDIPLDLPYTRQETRQIQVATVVTTNGADPASLPPSPFSPELADITEFEKDGLRLLKSIPDYPLKIARDLPLLRRLVQRHGQAAVARGLDEYRDSPRRIRPGDPNQVKRFVAQAARWLQADLAKHVNGAAPPSDLTSSDTLLARMEARARLASQNGAQP